MDLGSRVRLNNGVEIPRLGLGVWQMSAGRETRGAVASALQVGYRLVDTAKMYGNEEDVGAAVRESKLPRDEVFVTTKLWNTDHGYEPALWAFEASQRRLDLGPVDLYLIHWPEPRLRRDTWRAFERLYKDGKCRAIGVSNYMVRHLEELLASCEVVPAVNQIELHPFVYDPGLLDYCKKKAIVVEAYSPLTKGRRLKDPRIAAIAQRYGRTPAQVLIRWGLQHDLVTIPKSSRPERIRENADVFGFSISSEDMRALDSLSDGFRAAWDPTNAP